MISLLCLNVEAAAEKVIVSPIGVGLPISGSFTAKVGIFTPSVLINSLTLEVETKTLRIWRWGGAPSSNLRTFRFYLKD